MPTFPLSSCGLSCPSCLSRQMKQVELVEEEVTDLRTGAESRLLVKTGHGLTSNSSVVFESGRRRSTSPRWSPLRWSREAEGRVSGGGEEEEEEVRRFEERGAMSRARGDEHFTSGVVWLEVN